MTTVSLKGTLLKNAPNFTPLEFFEGWQRIQGVGALKTIIMLNPTTDKIDHLGLAILYVSQENIPAILERCKHFFIEYEAMIRAPNNTYTLIINGKPQILMYTDIYQNNNIPLTPQTKEKEKD